MAAGSSVWSNIRTEIDFLKQYPILNQATADNSSPTPGYLFGEVNSLTYIDNGCHCKQLVDYLFSRTKCDSPMVKIKVLKLLVYLMRNGHSNIENVLKSKEKVIRRLAGANGPPDPLHGKTLYENIRQMAMELLHVVYSEENASTFVSTNKSTERSPDGSTMSGYGSMASFKKLQGFGNTVQAPRTVGERVTEGFTYIVDKMLSSGSDHMLEKQRMLLTETLPQYEPIKINKPAVESLPTTIVSRSSIKESDLDLNSVSHVSHKEGYRIEKPGGGWDDANGDSFGSIQSDLQDDLHNRLGNHSVLSADSLNSKFETLSTNDWLDEHKVVDDFTVDQPVSSLTWDEITQACKTCSTLNCDKVIEFIISKLYDVTATEHTKLRALAFLEFLLYRDVVPIESLAKIALPHLQKRKKILKEASCRVKAKKIRKLIENVHSKYSW